jgi:lactaldehyde dehydrogenase/glycolaldehyde dehydrogenase
VTGRGSVVGHALASSPQIDIVSLTGSVGAGQSIMSDAAANITKVSLELGGKAPAIVFPDADLEASAEWILQSRIGNNGQICNNAERVYVHKSIKKEFTDILLRKFQAVKVGDPCADATVDMGPLVEQRALDSVAAKVEKAVSEGAKVLCGGHRIDSKGYFYPATLLDNCRQDMEIIHQETFGPVLPIVEFDDIDQVIAWANDVEYGLASSVFTKDIDTATKVCRELQFGETYINREHFEAMQGFHAGVKKSGIGGADGKHGVEEYLVTHVTYLDTHYDK